MRFTLYRIFNDSDELLYVGATINLAARLDHGHQKTKPWWDEAATVRLQHMDSMEALAAAELAAIAEEKPRYNVIGTGRPSAMRRREDRRPKGSGGLYQRADGMWVASVDVGCDATGKRIQKRRYSKVRETAELRLAELRQLYTSGDET